MGLSPLLKYPPLPFCGSKYHWKQDFDAVTWKFEEYDTIIDAFGGALWISHYLSRCTKHPRLICNDFDNVLPLVSDKELLYKWCVACVKVALQMAKCADEDGVECEDKQYKIGRDVHRVWHHRAELEECMRIIHSFPHRVGQDALRMFYAFVSVPTKNALYFNQYVPRTPCTDYIGRAERISQDAFSIEITPDMGKTLVICDPPYGNASENRWYNIKDAVDGKRDFYEEIGLNSINNKILEKFYKNEQCDVLLFGVHKELSLLERPMAIMERAIGRCPKAKYQDSVQYGYWYTH